MKKENLDNLTNVLKEIGSSLDSLLSGLLNKIEVFDEKYPYTSQNIQISLTYLFALVDLFFSILNGLLSLDFFPENALSSISIIENLVNSSFFKIWASPEKIFLITYLAVDIVIKRSPKKLSKIIKYNILLVFGLLMVQGLCLNLCDLLFNYEINKEISKWLNADTLKLLQTKQIGSACFIAIFLLFLPIYCFSYYFAMRRKIVIIDGFYWLTDSVAFWLKIKTPTMFKRKGKNTDNSSEKTEDNL